MPSGRPRRGRTRTAMRASARTGSGRAPARDSSPAPPGGPPDPGGSRGRPSPRGSSAEPSREDRAVGTDYIRPASPAMTGQPRECASPRAGVVREHRAKGWQNDAVRDPAEGKAEMATRAKTRRLPVLEGVLPIERSELNPAIVAGITLAALGIPEVMGYTKIAGMPVVTGLYTILIPIAVFACLGSSRHLVVGADSATAAIMAAGLAGLAPLASPDYVSLAGITAILCAGLLLLARLIRLGFLADFLSRSVLIGFLTGVGIQVAMGQLAGMLGVPGGTGGTLPKFFGTLEQIPDTSLATLAVSASVLGIILGLKAIDKRIPGALIAVVGSIVVSSTFDLSTHGVAILGPVPGGLPKFGVPSY